jgi:hypothetical protein
MLFLVVHHPTGKSHQQRALTSCFRRPVTPTLETHCPKRAFGHARSASCTVCGARCFQARKSHPRPANCCQKLSAARSPLPGLKPLFAPEMRDVIPLADRVAFVELNRGKRAAIAPHEHGGSPQLRRLPLGRPNARHPNFLFERVIFPCRHPSHRRSRSRFMGTRSFGA